MYGMYNVSVYGLKVYTEFVPGLDRKSQRQRGRAGWAVSLWLWAKQWNLNKWESKILHWFLNPKILHWLSISKAKTWIWIIISDVVIRKGIWELKSLWLGKLDIENWKWKWKWQGLRLERDSETKGNVVVLLFLQVTAAATFEWLVTLILSLSKTTIFATISLSKKK